MRDILHQYDALVSTGQPVGRAVVTSVWGSAPRPEGASMVATADLAFAGSVSGGCIESAAAQEIAQAIARGTPKLVTFGVSNEKAWEVGLACGGTIKVLVQPSVPTPVLAAARGEGGVVVATVVEGEGIGRSVVIGADAALKDSLATSRRSVADEADAWITLAIAGAARQALHEETSRTIEITAPAGKKASVFLEVFARQPTLLIFGAVHIAMALVPLAKTLGFRTVVADGRPAFLSRERFPEADQLILGWPEQAFNQLGIGPATYVCLLSHDPKFDDPAMELALRSPARYIGAIGSKKTQAARRARLLNLGFSEQDLTRLHGPIGLDLGGRAPVETALAILAQMVAVRYGREGQI